MDLLKDDLKKLYLRFLLPSLGSAMVMSIYTLTDAIVIGKGVGADALAALSITTPLLCIKKVRNMSFLTITVMGIVFSSSGILFPNGVCSIFMHTNKEISQIAQTGLRVYFIAFIPMGLNLLTSYYLQSILSVKHSLFISLLRNVMLSSAAILTFPLIFGGNSLWMVMPVVEGLVVILSITFLRK